MTFDFERVEVPNARLLHSLFKLYAPCSRTSTRYLKCIYNEYIHSRLKFVFRVISRTWHINQAPSYQKI